MRAFGTLSCVTRSGWIRRKRGHSQLPGFSVSQSRIIQDDSPIQQVIAAAGSGKTRTVVGLANYRLNAGRDGGRAQLMLSFSRKAVGEMRARLSPEARDRTETSTFHSFCFRRLREYHPRFKGGVQVITDEERRLFLRNQLREHAEVLGGAPYDLWLDHPREFRNRFPEIAMRVFRAFYKFKRESGRLEYEDLITLMLVELRRDGPFARKLRELYSGVIVDEFQDTDPRQLEFLQLLRPPRLLAVGDDWQAIYSFRGATVQPFLDFRRIFRGANVHRLAENYRSLRPIVNLGARIIQGSSRQLPKRVVAVRGSRPRLPTLATALERGGEPEIAARLLVRERAVVLARTNYRCARWIAAGLPPERVLTVHRAKGLEFPVVFVDLIAGWSGMRSAEEDAARQQEIADEEVRVLYVAASRAENLLVVLHRPEYGAEDREGRYWRDLIGPHVRNVETAALDAWLEREARG